MTNIINKIHKAFKVATSEVCEENVYKPRAKGIVCVKKTIYPEGRARISKNGTGEWYGIIEN